MFIKYVSFQKVQAAHTVLEFRGGSETVKVNYFDVPAVSIEAETEAEIMALIASQPAEIMCVEVTKIEFMLLVASSSQIKRYIERMKNIYLSKVANKLEELDYDSLATVKLWEGDPIFGAEATRILMWYKALVQKNYELLNTGDMLTEDEYILELNTIVF